MEELKGLIRAIKNGDEEKIYLVIQKMTPLINKYIRILYKDEREDVYSEMVSAIWEAIVKMQYYDENAKCITYLKNAMHIRFLELYRKSRNVFDSEIKDCDMDYVFELTPSLNNKNNDMTFREDMRKLLFNYNNKQYDLYCAMILEEMSDIELAQRFKVSRQYVNRIRKKVYGYILEEYYGYKLKKK